MAKKLVSNDRGKKSERSCRPRAAGDLVADIGGVSFKRFGFVQSAIVSRWSEIVGDKFARLSQPESIRFPTGTKSGGALTLLVEGASAPLLQHSSEMIMERVNRFFGYGAINRIIFRQGRMPRRSGKNATPPPVAVAVPKAVGEGLREIADPGLRACLELLGAKIAASKGGPSFADDTEPTP